MGHPRQHCYDVDGCGFTCRCTAMVRGKRKKGVCHFLTDGSQSCSWVSSSCFQIHKCIALMKDTSAANTKNSSKYLDKLLSQVVNCWEGFESSCCILSENPVGRTCSTQNSLHQFQVLVCWVWDPLSGLTEARVAWKWGRHELLLQPTVLSDRNLSSGFAGCVLTHLVQQKAMCLIPY